MKKILLAVVFCILSSDVKAADFSFTYFGNSGGNYSMVSCDYATSQAEELFEKFAVREAEINCYGGILPSGMMVPLTLDVKFTPVVPGERPLVRKEKFVSRSFGSTSCEFNTRLVRALVPNVKNVTITRSQTACFNPESPFSYEFDVKVAR